MLYEEALEPTDILSNEVGINNVTLIPEQQELLEEIQNLLLSNNKLIAVSGPHGSGKSTLAKALVRNINSPQNTVLIDANITLGVSDVFTHIGGLIQQHIPENRRLALELLKAQLEKRVKQGQKLIVIIDQAEQLDVDTLTELAQIAFQIKEGLSFVLFGLSGYQDSITAIDNQARLHALDIPPLSKRSAQRVLRQVYSPNEPLPLTEIELNTIYKQSYGLVGKLLMLAADLFLAADEPQTPTRKIALNFNSIKDYFPFTHVVALAFLLVILLITFLYSPAKNEDNTTVPERLVFEEMDMESLAVENDMAAELEVRQNESKVKLGADDVVTAEVRGLSSKQAAAVAKDKNDIRKQALAAQLQSTSSEVQTEKNLTVKTDKQQILAMKAGFVVQLFGGYEQNNAANFKQTEQERLNNTRLYMYKTSNKGKPWFVVIAGTYASRNEAEQAVKSWPEELQKQSPWIRDIKTVQESLY